MQSQQSQIASCRDSGTYCRDSVEDIWDGQPLQGAHVGEELQGTSGKDSYAKAQGNQRLLVECNAAGLVSKHAFQAFAARSEQQVRANCFCASC